MSAHACNEVPGHWPPRCTICGRLLSYSGRQKPSHIRLWNWKHGLSKGKFYRLWMGIRTRCNNPNAKDFYLYGGRGIKMCEEWERNFSAFYEWVMGNDYRPGLQIDRINNDGNYEPSNCRFVTLRENARNRSTSKRTPKIIAQVTLLLQASPNLTEIGRQVGLSRKSVREIAQDIGVYEPIAKLGRARYNLWRHQVSYNPSGDSSGTGRSSK